MRKRSWKTWFLEVLCVAVVTGAVMSLLNPLLDDMLTERIDFDSPGYAAYKLRFVGHIILLRHSANKEPFPSTGQTLEGGALSWRVAVLRHLKVHLDEPWDSEHNRKLISQMPSDYKCNSCDLGEGKTNILAVTGPGTFFGEGTQRVAVEEVEDGLANTIMLVEADPSQAVIWTEPKDWCYDPENPLHGLGGLRSHEGKSYFFVVSGDGKTHIIPGDIPLETWHALLTRDGGEKVDWPKSDLPESLLSPW